MLEPLQFCFLSSPVIKHMALFLDYSFYNMKKSEQWRKPRNVCVAFCLTTVIAIMIFFIDNAVDAYITISIICNSSNFSIIVSININQNNLPLFFIYYSWYYYFNKSFYITIATVTEYDIIFVSDFVSDVNLTGVSYD